ncbi:MAG: hypothetical protein ACI83Y_002059, partial [Candidatus Azotimanducaceae bacterium]
GSLVEFMQGSWTILNLEARGSVHSVDPPSKTS